MPETIGSRYRVIEEVGSGHWGRVLLVEDLLRGGRVALKTVRVEPDDVPRGIVEEFRALTRVRHPNLSRVYDLGRGGMGLFFTREYVPGVDLVAALAGADARTMAAAAAVLCHAIASMHDHGVVHGDLSPANVIGRPGDPGSLRIIDFGLSVAAGAVGSYSGVQGSVHYVAPEILGGSPPDRQTDLYALGALLYHAVAGSPPFTGTVGEVIQKHVDVSPVPLGKVRKGVPVALAAVVGRLLAKDPSRRYASAWDALADLEGGAPDVVRVTPEAALVGREREIDSIVGLALPGSEASVIAVEGEAGAGKTRLLEAVRWRLQLEGRVNVVEGREAARGIGDIVAHLGLLAGGEPGADAGAFIAAAMQKASAVLLVDDVDGAAEASLEAIRTAARAIDIEGGPPIVVAGRPGRAVEAIVGEVERGRKLSVGELGGDAVDRLVALLAGRSVPGLAARIVEHAGALPGHVEEVVRALVMASGDLATLPVPAGIGDAIRARMEAMGRAERAVVAVAAVVQDPVGGDGSEEIAGLDGREFEQAARRLAAAGMLVEEPPGRFAFGRVAVREAAYDALDPEERRRLHAALFDTLSDDPAPTGERLVRAAVHSVRSVPAGARSEAAASLALSASRVLMAKGDARAASRMLREALEVSSGGRSGEVRIALAEALSMCGEFGEAIDLLDRAASESEGETRGEALHRAARVMESAGAYGEASEALGRAIALGSGDRGGMLDVLARVLLARGDAAGALAAAESAIEAGSRSGPLSTKGLALSYMGRHADALASLEGALEEARREGGDSNEAMIVGRLAVARARAGDAKGALEMYEEAARLAETSGDRGRLPTHLANLGTALQGLGEVGRAIGLYREAERLARRMGKTSVVVASLVNLADRYAYVGAVEEAREAAQRALEIARRRHMTAFEARAHLALADCAACESPSAGLDDAGRAKALFEGLGLERDAAEAEVVAAELLLWGGDPTSAAERVEKVLSGGHAEGEAAARARVVLGEALAARGEADRALPMLQEIARSGDDESRMRALGAMASLGQRAGDDVRVRDLVKEAEEVLGRIEARVPQEHRESFRRGHPARRALERLAKAGAGAQGAEERLIRLMEVNRALLTERDPRKLLALTLDTAVDLCGAERGFLLTIGARGAVHVEVARNLDREAIRSPRLKVSRSIAEKVAETGVPILTVNASEDERFERFESVRDLRLRSVMCVPIRGRDRILGTLYLDNRFQPGRFNEADMRMLLAFADVVAVALENARLMEENESRAAELETAKSDLEAASRKQARRLETALKELEATREALGLKYDYSRIIGRSAGMLRVFQTLDRIIDTHVPVLVTGESGTGKELIARAIHFNGPRKNGPFVSVNCGAIPESLLESELFGYVKGAFTGAVRGSDGLFASAHAGTLFLDEIGEMSPAMQTKLLRVLQEGEYRPVGAIEDRRVDVRVLAATNRDLVREVESGGFREDLYYRLNVVTIHVPALRARLEDVPLLSDHILDQFAGEMGGARKRLTPGALEVLLSHSWPGNVRELENVLKNAAIMSRSDDLRPDDIRVARADSASLPPSTALNLAEMERQTIVKVLEITQGNKSRAAEILGISRLTLYRKLREITGEDVP